MPAHHITKRNITVSYRNKSYTVDRSHVNFDEIAGFLRSGDYKSAIPLMSKAAAVNEFGRGHISVINGKVCLGDRVVTNKVAKQIIKMADEGQDVKPLCMFLENLLANPEPHVVEELYDFINAGHISITDDGHFLAYKRVQYHPNGKDLVDMYSKSIKNNVGDVCEMSREACDKNRHNHCSAGLHFCSRGYLSSYGAGDMFGQVIIVRINPRDVTSIPSDYDFMKGRTCRYEVVAVNPRREDEELFTKTVMTVEEVKQVANETHPQEADDEHYMDGRADRLAQGTRKLKDKSPLQKASYNRGYYSVDFKETARGVLVAFDVETGRQIKTKKKDREQHRELRGLRQANIKVRELA